MAAAPSPFTVEHFVAWAAKLELDSGDPWVVEPYFADFLTDVFAGFRLCWLVVPEENAKTTSVAGLALYVIEHKTNAYVPVAASTRDQAQWIYRQAELFADPTDRFKCLEGYRRIRHDPRNSRIQVFAADDRSGDGIIPGGIAVLDELHRHKNLALYRTWLGKLRKRGAQLVVISTAGEVGAEFEKERSRLLSEGKLTRRGRCFQRSEHELDGTKLAVIHDWAVPKDSDLSDLDLVNEANPFSGVTVESLAEKLATSSSLEHWSRFTCNLAARTAQAAVTEAEWAAAVTDEDIPEGVPVGLGLDVAWKIDCTALVPLWMASREERVLGHAVILTPPRNGNSLDPYKIEDAILTIHQRNPIHTVVMDTSRAEQLAEWISQTTGAEVIDRPQTNQYATVDHARFMEALRNGWLKHQGDLELTRHVMNAISRVLPGGAIRFDRPVESRGGGADAQHELRVIDGLTAASMIHAFLAEEEESAELLVAFG